MKLFAVITMRPARGEPVARRWRAPDRGRASGCGNRLIPGRGVDPALSSTTRRELLRRAGAAVAALGTASLAGCVARMDADAGADADTGDDPLADERLFVHDDVDTPASGIPATVGDVDDATAALVPAAERAERLGADALDRGVTVCFVGRDAPLHLQRVCAADGRPHGVPSTSWTPQDVFAVAKPRGDRLDTHHVEHVALPDGLAWAVGEALGWGPDEGAGSPVGRVRRSGRTDVGAYDARERLSVADGRAVVRTTAAVESAEALPWERYDVAGLRLVLSFYDRPVVAGTTLTGDGARVRDGGRGSDREDDAESTTYDFVPTDAATRRRLAVGARTAVEVNDGTESLSYVGNARVRWRRRLRLDDGVWVAHTPGERSWHGLGADA